MFAKNREFMDKRVKFDFEICFTNGGSIKGEDFRFDILGNDISDKELADCIVEDLKLLMVKQIKILNKEILTETLEFLIADYVEHLEHHMKQVTSY